MSEQVIGKRRGWASDSVWVVLCNSPGHASVDTLSGLKPPQ
jgi:hypothetical protein